MTFDGVVLATRHHKTEPENDLAKRLAFGYSFGEVFVRP